MVDTVTPEAYYINRRKIMRGALSLGSIAATAVRMEQTFALTPTERNQGWILACQSHLTSAATIELHAR